MESTFEVYSRMWLVVSIPKTITMQSSFFHANLPCVNEAGKTSLRNEQSFCYLGSVIPDDTSIDEEINQIRQASSSFGWLHNRFAKYNLQTKTKVTVYHAVCISILLYSSEAWTTHRKHIKAHEAFHIRCLQRILKITWEDRIPHIETFECVGSMCVAFMKLCRTLCWADHVVCIDSNGELEEGSRCPGEPKKRWKDILKKSLKICSIPPCELETLAADSVRWRHKVSEGINHYETEWIRDREEKWTAWHQMRLHPTAPTGHFPCTICLRVCNSRIGLLSHLQVHERRNRDKNKRIWSSSLGTMSSHKQCVCCVCVHVCVCAHVCVRVQVRI